MDASCDCTDDAARPPRGTNRRTNSITANSLGLKDSSAAMEGVCERVCVCECEWETSLSDE